MEGSWVVELDVGSARDSASRSGLLVRIEDPLSEVEMVDLGSARGLVSGQVLTDSGVVSSAREVLEKHSTLGASALASLRGRFACVLLEESAGRLRALRDPVGVYPLFHAQAGSSLFLSPSPSLLLDQRGVSRAIDRGTLANHLWHRWPDKERTYFAAVRRVPPGHFLELSGGAQRLKRYWNPAVELPTATDVSGRFQELMDQAIERCRSDAGTGVFLSGGLDSVSIASRLVDGSESAARQHVGLSLAFEHPDCDELRIQRLVADSLRMRHEVRRVPAEVADNGVLGRAAALARDWPFPLINVWNGEFHELTGVGRRMGCEVILTGSGGDDWLGVSPYLAADLIRSLQIGPLATLVRSVVSSHRLSYPRALHLVGWSFGLRAILRNLTLRAGERLSPGWAGRWTRNRLSRSMPSWLAPDAGLRSELVESGSPRIVAGAESFYGREMKLWLDHPLLSLEFEESFELGRRAGTRIAHPFLDPDLIAFLCRVSPASLLGDGGADRFLLRRRLADRFPDLGFQRQKKSDARAFFRQLAMREGLGIWRRLGGPVELVRLGIVDSRGVNAEMARLASNGSADVFRVWDLINVESWLQGRT